MIEARSRQGPILALSCLFALAGCIEGKERPQDAGIDRADAPMPTDTLADAPYDRPPSYRDQRVDQTIDMSLCHNNTLDEGEDCEGTTYSVADCLALGFEGGTLACTDQCIFDLTACLRGCGNGVVENGELCDGAGALQGSCARYGFSAGELECAPSCATFRMTGCSFGCDAGKSGPGCAACEVGFDPKDCTGCAFPYQSAGDDCLLQNQCGPRFLLDYPLAADERPTDSFEEAHGLVTDTTTGLVWSRCPVGTTWSDLATCNGTPTTFTFAQLGGACAGNLGGYADWRVPRPHELESLVSYREDRSFDAWAFPTLAPSLSTTLWASQLLGSASAYTIDPRMGDSRAVSATEAHEVLCVRSPDLPAPQRRFRVVSNDGSTVADLWAKLVWARCAQGMSWNGAVCVGTPMLMTQERIEMDCATRGAGWRAPRVRELRSLREFCQASGSEGLPDGVAFPGFLPGAYWTASRAKTDTWTVGFGALTTAPLPLSERLALLCVRDP